MKRNGKIKRIFIVLEIIFTLSIFSTLYIYDDLLNNKGSTEFRDESRLKSPKKSGSWNVDHIYIYNDNWSSTDLEWIQNRSGSWADPHIIENVTINVGGSGSGIFIEDSKDYFIIRNCTVYNSGDEDYDAGIKLQRACNGTIINNNCSNNGVQDILLFDFCENNTISGNLVNNPIRLWDYCDNNTISGNTASSPTVIQLRYFCDNNLISGNDLWIWLFISCDNNKISDNKVNGAYNGILLDYCDYNIISDNTVNENFYGIELIESSSNNIIGNTINNNEEESILLRTGSNYNTITNNIANNNDIGIALEFYCNYNIISHNTANNNSYCGIFLWDSCSWNTISYNTLIGNYICIYESSTCSHNTFKKNKCEISPEETPFPLIITISVICAGAVVGLVSIFWYRRKKRET